MIVSNKKGGIASATLCQYAGDHQPLGSTPRDCSSFLITRFIQAAKDSSPSCCWACSIASLSSGSNRNWNGGLPRLSFLCADTSITPNVMCLCVMTHCIQASRKATPRTVPAVPRRLTNNVKEPNAMAKPKCTQTHPEFTSRSRLNADSMVFTFAIVPRSARLAALSRCRIVHVTARTESQARASLAALSASGEAIGLSLVFMSRIQPRQGRGYTAHPYQPSVNAMAYLQGDLQ